MKSAKPLLVLLSIGVGAKTESAPLGSACVAAALRRRYGEGLGLRLLEADPDEEAAVITARLLAEDPSFIGLSVYAWNRALMVSVAGALRGARPGLLLFAGGPEPTADPAALLADAPLDFAVAGEGEATAVEAFGLLLGGTNNYDDSALASVPGVLTRAAALSGATRPARRRAASATETLPSPWLDGLVSAEGRDEVAWELSRGCAFHCAYCFEGRGEGGVRVFPRGRIEAELERFSGAGVGRVFVLDPTFNWKRERALELLGLFAERGRGIHFKFEARAELLDKSLARAFARLDCSLQIGLQSADPAVLAKAGRPGFDPRRFAEKLSLLDAEGLTWGLDLIYGLPGDDLAGFRRSLDYALGLQPNHLDVFPLALLPGTELAERAGEYGLVAAAEAPHLLLEAPGFSREDMAAAGELARACDRFYSRGRAVSWFQRALAPLRAKPAAFLSRFAAWSRGRSAGEDIESSQLGFLETEYRAKGLEALLPVLTDTLRLEGAFARAVAEGESSVLALSYEAAELLDPPSPDFRELAARLRRKTNRIRVSPGPRGPKIARLGRGDR
jgi:radical SAM superfamily enzyme YgiQ (UPF0313 family)